MNKHNLNQQDTEVVVPCPEEEDEMTPEQWREFDELMNCAGEIVCIRTTCHMDRVKTLDDAIGELEDYITDLKELQREGYALCEPIIDDYGYLYLEKHQ